MLVFDIETCGLPNAADFLEPIQPDRRLKDPAKIAADLTEKEQARTEKLSLDWNVGRIVAIGWWTERAGETVRLCPDEIEETLALASFWDETRHRTLVGFNIKGFDLRFLVQRSRYLGLDFPLLDFSKYSKKGIVDLFLELTFNEGYHDQGCMRHTLQAFCKRFGIPVTDTIQGKDASALIAAGDWRSVEAHVRSDLALTVSLAKRLGVIRPMTEVAL